MKITRLLLLIGCTFILCSARAQIINAIPYQSDFCAANPVTYTIDPPAPGNSIEWQFVDYSNFGLNGQEFYTVIGYGTVLNVSATPGFTCPGGYIRAVEKDPFGSIVNSNSIAMLVSTNSSINHSIPIYPDLILGGCIGLTVPPCFDPTSTAPFSAHRWTMWYKNGIPTGVTSSVLQGPLTDSAWYEYKVRLTCGDTLSTGLYYLWQPSAPILTAQGPTTFCTGDSVTLDLFATTSIDKWYKDGAPIAGSFGKSSLKVGTTGQYTASTRHSTINGATCYLNSNTISVTQNPGAFITGTEKFCSTDSVQLTCTSASSYQWKKNGVNIPGATTQSVWVKTTGNYTVNTSGITCNVSQVKTITKYQVPSGLSLTPNGSYSLCNGNATPVSISGNNITSWQWQRNSTNMPGATSASFIATKTGTYKCVVTNEIGCSKTSSIVQITSSPVSALPQKTIQLQPGSEAKDSYITSASGYMNANFGNNGTLEISNWYKGWLLEQSCLQFDFSQIPDFSAISNATLQLYVDSFAQKGVNANTPNFLYIKRNIQSWNESTISWDNVPATTVFQSLTIPCSTITSSSFLTANITDFTRNWLGAPTDRYGINLQVDPAYQYTWLSIASSDTSAPSYRPKLTVTYYAADINASGPTNLCTGGSVQFSTNVGAYTYQWYKNGVAIGGATGVNYTATTAGDYHVVLTVASGCTARSLVKKVTVNGLPQINLTPSADSVSYCFGSPITLKVDSLSGYTFQWKRNNVNIGGAIYSSYSPTTTAWYSIKTTSNCGISTKDSVHVTRINNAAPVITAGGPTTFCAGQNVLLTSTTFTGAVTQWYKNNVLTAGGTSYTATTAGAYYVVQTASGCSKTSNTITTIVNCREGEFISSEEISMQVYPNPAGDNLQIELSGLADNQESSISLSEISGKSIMTTEITNGQHRLPVQHISDGLYLLTIRQNGNIAAIRRVMIRH